MRKSSLTERLRLREIAFSDIGSLARAKSSSTARPFSRAGARYFGLGLSLIWVPHGATPGRPWPQFYYMPGIPVGKPLIAQGLRQHLGGEARHCGRNVPSAADADRINEVL